MLLALTPYSFSIRKLKPATQRSDNTSHLVDDYRDFSRWGDGVKGKASRPIFHMR